MVTTIEATVKIGIENLVKATISKGQKPIAQSIGHIVIWKEAGLNLSKISWRLCMQEVNSLSLRPWTPTQLLLKTNETQSNLKMNPTHGEDAPG